ncbi:MAG: hypothetical protein DRP29_04575 [Thermodesulfobacteriota bacterium]|nr:MAG: hypothetical protein DRP29_04575 [Thermodesulfobacteriota bacterium]
MADLYMSNITGLLDIDSIVQGLLQSKIQQIEKLNNEKALLQGKASSISNLLGALNDLQDFIDSLNITNLFTAKTAIVSDSSILNATVSSDAPNITLNITVNQLSQAEIRISTAGVSDLDTAISASTFTITYWTSDSTYETYTIDFSGGTLQDLVDAINEAQDKIEASIYYDGTSYKLMLSEKDVANSTKETTDSSTVIEVDTLPTELIDSVGGVPLETLQYAQNAEIQIGSGSVVTSADNTFENLVTGLNITVLEIGNASVSIEDDYSQVNEALGDLLENINSVIDLVNSVTEQGGIFQGNAIITQLKPQFFRLMEPLIDLGIINISEEGKYSLNTEAFDNIIEENKDELMEAFSQVKENFSSALTGIICTFEVYKQTQDREIEYIDEKIEDLQINLAKEEERLRLEFSKIEALMYQNEQLRINLENLIVPISEIGENND